MSGQPIITGVETLPNTEFKWLALEKISWTDQEGTPRVWEAAVRKTTGETNIDAVAICPILLHPSKPASVMIIHQFRPTMGVVSVEFPAGLVDPGENVRQAALRELKEETGYDGRITTVTPVLGSDAGMSPSKMVFVVAEVDLKDGEEMPKQNLGEGEFIEREIVPLNALHVRLLECAMDGKSVDSKLFHFAYGMHFSLRNVKKYGLAGMVRASGRWV